MQEYALARLCSPSSPSQALLEQIAQLNGDLTTLGRAHATLRRPLRLRCNQRKVEARIF